MSRHPQPVPDCDVDGLECEHCYDHVKVLLWIYVQHPYDADLGTNGQAQWWCKKCVEKL